MNLPNVHSGIKHLDSHGKTDLRHQMKDRVFLAVTLMIAVAQSSPATIVLWNEQAQKLSGPEMTFSSGVCGLTESHMVWAGLLCLLFGWESSVL